MSLLWPALGAHSPPLKPTSIWPALHPSLDFPFPSNSAQGQPQSPPETLATDVLNLDTLPHARSHQASSDASTPALASENAASSYPSLDASRARTPSTPSRSLPPSPSRDWPSRRPSPVPCPPWPIKTHPRTHSAHTPPHSFPSTSTLSLESTQGAALGCCSLQRRSPAPVITAVGEDGEDARTPPLHNLLPDAVKRTVLPETREKKKAPPARSATPPTTLDLAAGKQTPPVSPMAVPAPSLPNPAALVAFRARVEETMAMGHRIPIRRLHGPCRPDYEEDFEDDGGYQDDYAT
nr:uncharacterized protein LOC127336226 [Lolium perenne]